ncbi:hypothetical protein [Brachybacterium nesterenkovii]|uniref:hypothetical protein n=1 Tax=Brachybacterium nesterenkovii TaxID=47847 RepID=UPI00321C3599
MGMLGLAPDEAGNGLTPGEHQQVIRSQYTAHGVLSGCEVLASSSALTVTVQPGAVVIPTSGTGAVMGPVPQTTITFDPAPATGSDYYDIYVACKNQAGAKAYVGISKNGDAPALSARLDRWVIPAGVTNARAGYSMSWKDYAVPVGSGQSRIIDWQDPTGYGGNATSKRFTQLTKTINLAQDRLLDFRISQTFSAKRGDPRGGFQWIMTDNRAGVLATPVLPYDEWSVPTGPMIGGTYQTSFITSLAAGQHTLTWERQQVVGGTAVHAGGQAPADNGYVLRPLNRLEVFDLGIHR